MKCGSLTPAGDQCSLSAHTLHRFHAAWRGWIYGIVIWTERDSVGREIR